MVDRVTTARLRADASQFKREIASAAAAAKALDAALGRGNLGSGGFDSAADSASRLDNEITDLNKNKLIVAKSWNADLADVNSNLAEAGAHVHTFNDEVGGLQDTQSEIRATASASDDLATSLDRVGESARVNRKHISLFGVDLGAAENRMQTITQALLAIGPAAVPVVAAAGVAVGALAGQLTFAAAGAGTALLAFSGVGDALKALNNAALEPSVANIDKLRVAFDELGPAGSQFVLFLQRAREPLEELQQLSGAGLFPGLQEGLEGLLDQMPQLEAIVGNVSQTLGDLAAEGGNALDNPVWQEFFTYLATDANQILTNMGHTIGLFVQGLASMITAFGPLTTDFSGGLENMARAFAAWSEGLADSQGFQTFISYVRDITPQLKETLEALVVVLLDLAKASSGLGGPALAVLEALAKTLSAFLELPVAPWFLAVASALGALSTAMRLGKWAGGAALVKFMTSIGPASASAVAGMRGATTSMAGLSAALGGFGRAARLGAGSALLLGAAFSDLDESWNVTNTATFAGLGLLMGGPYGLAVGTAVGATLDLTSANDDLYESIKRSNQVVADTPGAITSRITALQSMQDELEETTDSADAWWKSGPFGMEGGGLLNILDDQAINDATLAVNKENAALESMKVALSGIANIGKQKPFDFTEDAVKLDDIATQVEPVLARMGLTLEDMAGLWALGGSVRQDFIDDFIKAREAMDSLAGRGKVVANAIADLDNAFFSTADSASTLATALESLVTPFLGLVGAQDAWATGLHDFESSLSKSTSSLRGFSQGAIENRAAVSGQVQLLVDMITAQAEAGKGSEFLAESLSESREELIRVATAAGISRKQLEGFLAKAGLTPKLINTIFRAQGITEAENQARNLADSYNKLPKEVRVAIKQDGVPQSERELDSLKKKYDLTPKQLRIVADLRDNASVKIAGLRAKVRQMDKERATPKADMDISAFQLKAERVFDIHRRIASEKPKSEVQAETSAAEAALARAERALKNWDAAEGEATASVDDKASPVVSDIMADLVRLDNYNPTSVVTVVQRTVTKGSAGGGLIRGPGGPTDDRAGVYALSNQEFVSRAASVDKYGADAYYALNSLRADRNQLRKAIGLAGGGLVGLADGGKPGDRRTLSSGDVFDKTLRGDGTALTLKDLERAMRALRDEAHDVVVAERALRKERQQSKDLTHKIAQAERDEHTSKERLHELHQRERQQSKDLAKAEKELAKQRDQLSNATQKLKDRERELLAQASAISDAITAQGAIFGGEGTSVTAGGILSKLKSAVKDARQFKEDIATLRARGLDEDLIAQLYEQGSTPEGVQAVHNLATASKAMLAQINRQQRRLEHIGAATGTQSVRDQGRGGGNVVVNLNGPIKTTDVDRLAKQLPKEIRKALRIASSA